MTFTKSPLNRDRILTSDLPEIVQTKDMSNSGNALVREWMDQISLTTRLFTQKFTRQFRCKVSVGYETDTYLLKTADDVSEIEQILKLRHEVFCKELQNRKKLFQIELDELDLKCDHLMIIDRQSGDVVGTYRLFSSHFFKKFYSESEFDLSLFLEEPGTKLELGRASILPEHRNGSVIQLLWRGICEYMKKTETRFLMGCSSVNTLDPQQILATLKHIQAAGHATSQYSIFPKPGYRPEEHGVFLNEEPSSTISIELPPLLQGYLKAGAKLAPIPAVDRDFQCIDFFTVLDYQTMHPLYKRRFFGE